MNIQILILDFGSQFTQLIARRIREIGIYCEIKPYSDISINDIKKFETKGLILSGGPSSILEKNAPTIPQEFWNLGLPILGICYGHQLMCMQFGGQVQKNHCKEFGRAEIKILDQCKLFENIWNINTSQTVWMSHGDSVQVLPKGFSSVARTSSDPNTIIVDDKRNFYGVQFHPEVGNIPECFELFKNFVLKICKCECDWNMGSFYEQSLELIKSQIGNKKVICGLSGGVDSAVTAVLIHEAIGDQLTCIFVDNGLLRKNDACQIKEIFAENYQIPLVYCDASDLFLENLHNITDPETKRKIIGKLFIELFEKEAQKLGGADFLAQGTLYPDIIESVSFCGNKKVTIKSHHNVGGLPEKMKLSLIEPLKTLFKDEVRLLGEQLKIPKKILNQHPFPGPGLAIRIIGSVNKSKCDILRQVDSIYLEEIHKSGLYDQIWQAFAVLLPIKTVGVMGDQRTYDNVCVLRAVTSTDGMNADVFFFDSNFLTRVTTRIINEVKGINRVTYDYTSKPPGTIEWE